MKKTVLVLFSWLFFAFPASADLPDFADLIAKASPAVVKINTVQTVNGGRTMIPQGQVPEIFRDFFEQYRQQQPERNAYSMGSGFIVSSDGYILTNHHVIDGANEITVRLNDRQEYSAEVIGSDRRSDVAVLKIDAKNLPFLKFADSEQLRVGEWVVAIGSPFGLDYSASAGIVSAIGRSLPSETGENYVPFIQTDVAINPGNSGGPLFNLQGEVVGINSQIYTRSGGFMGLSFAIPSLVAEEVMNQIKDKGHVARGWLGVQIQDVTTDMAVAMGLDKPTGALIVAVGEDTPAEESGIEPGDVIVEFNGSDISESGDLPHIVGLLAPGTKAKAIVVREGKRKSLTVKVGELERSDEIKTASINKTPSGDTLGLIVEELDDKQRKQMRLRGGVLVTAVSPDSPAAAAQLIPGDVIVQLGYSRISSAADYRAAIGRLPQKTPIAIRFFRNGQPVFRTIELK